MPPVGFQAVILCGPGESMSTFTSNRKDFPKALIPIANRPMVWYPLDWCYRMGVTNIQLITPPESAGAIEAALSQNPYLTSLPAPKPDVLAPKDLTQTTGTAEIFRFPQVYTQITGDFIVLPCDIICELDGTSLLESWMVQEAGLGAATGGINDVGLIKSGLGGERSGRRGGLAVWYPTKGENGIKDEETDFVATTPLPAPVVSPHSSSLRPDISNVVYSMPTDTLNDVTDEHKGFPIRHSLLRKHGRIKMKMDYRSAHIFFFPYWILEMIKHNEIIENVSEDVLGWWAKAGWQTGLGDKLGLREVLFGSSTPSGDLHESMNLDGVLDDEVDVASLSSTWTSPPPAQPSQSAALDTSNSLAASAPSLEPLTIPPILAYIQRPHSDRSATSSNATTPSNPVGPLIRRVDTVPALLATSLLLARLPSHDDIHNTQHQQPQPISLSALAHPSKIAYPDGITPPARVEADTCLLDSGVTVGARASVRESVIGAGCVIGAGARLQRCVLLEGAVVGDNVQLAGCVLGRRCRVEGGAVKGKGKEGGGEEAGRTRLSECEVQEGFVVPWGTEAKGEEFAKGLSEGEGEEGEWIGGGGDDEEEEEDMEME
ncbi:MAG: hypothetical protein M1821_005607 [Bathelium mastoideum]|nr:MAG: hypothetical protein M1821_005607 [Bathelium mastoideum]